ncbi:MAG: hypothetical protein CMK99_05205 [Pseudomonas sp.]|jgi:hypothetical protein|uniref:Uncharacterized protein n=1 Tax=Stutzerimonas stutzeri TaxID=316 RepID=A0A5S5BBM4_STUST|nr:MULTISPECIES: hypothetical protein [Pseudomonadaceae]MAX90129.1 hypothetical protein [Pseudomonas sp.]MBU0813315.1 hypothetical protein [Gammaproteobacteria bacterium]MBK3849799.1 hypothetical protein [Stutzerimonas xanthomarina]MBK57989.1 hypothetical protein [Pseudomonas sp.]MBU0853529.1 hypothetical protein [Gammaproteobacteria bacterium]|tara:strand:+ start:1281 stop:1763 length:483 start_codon:yes stop_codon:yes gene_type:complete
MNSQNETGAVGKRMLRVMAPAALLLWAFVAMGTTGTASSSLDGHYSSSGRVLLSDGTTLKVSQSLVFNKGRFYSMTRNAPAIVEASGRLETDLLGRASLVVEEGQVHGLGSKDEMDDDLVFNLFYGSHKGARITLEQVGSCLYGVETRQVYCADDHPNRG